MSIKGSVSGFFTRVSETLSRGIGGSKIPWSVLVLALAGVWAVIMFIRTIMFFFS